MNKTSSTCHWIDIVSLSLLALAVTIIVSFNIGRVYERSELRTRLLKVKSDAYVNIRGTDVAIDAFGNARDLRKREVR